MRPMCFGHLKGNCHLPRCKFEHADQGICYDFLVNGSCGKENCTQAHRQEQNLLCNQGEACTTDGCKFAHPSPGQAAKAEDYTAAPSASGVKAETDDAAPADGEQGGDQAGEQSVKQDDEQGGEVKLEIKVGVKEEAEDADGADGAQDDVEVVQHTDVGESAGANDEDASTLTETLL